MPVSVLGDCRCSTVVQVNVHASQLRTNARILDELDVTLAFATLATELNLVRPTLTEEYGLPHSGLRLGTH